MSENAPGVCFIISSFAPMVGGAERFTERLSRRVARHGCDVAVLTRRQPGTSPNDTVGGVPVRRLGLGSRSKLGALTFGLHALWFLAIRMPQVRILHVQNPDTPLYVGALARALTGKRVVFTVHGDPDVLLGGGTPKAKLCRRLIRWAGMEVVALTEAARDRLVALGIPRNRVRVLSNGVDTSVFRPPTAEERRTARQSLGSAGEDVVYLFVGRLIPSKRVDLLLEAWSELDLADARVVIVGTGEREQHLRSLADSLGLRRVRFEGFEEDVRPYLYGADVFVLPSEIEGLSMALLEAMAVGVPPVVSRSSGTSVPVQHEVNGLQFAPGDAGGLAEALQRLHDRSLRERLGRRARETVRRRYSLDTVGDRHVDLYRRLAATVTPDSTTSANPS